MLESKHVRNGIVESKYVSQWDIRKQLWAQGGIREQICAVMSVLESKHYNMHIKVAWIDYMQPHLLNSHVWTDTY